MFSIFLIDDAAQGLVEYALVISLVSLAAVAAMKLLGQKSSTTIHNVATLLK